MTKIPIAHPGHMILNQHDVNWLPDAYKRPNMKATKTGLANLFTRLAKRERTLYICEGLQYDSNSNYLHEYPALVKSNTYSAVYGAGIGNHRGVGVNITSDVFTPNSLLQFLSTYDVLNYMPGDLNRACYRPGYYDSNGNIHTAPVLVDDSLQSATEKQCLNYIDIWEYHIALYADSKIDAHSAENTDGTIYIVSPEDGNCPVYIQFRIPLYKQHAHVHVSTDSATGTQLRTQWAKLPMNFDEMFFT